VTSQDSGAPPITTELRTNRLFGDTNWSLVIGAAYVLAVSANEYVVVTILGSAEKSQRYIALHGGLVVFATTLTHLIGVLLVAILVWRRRSGSLRTALYAPSIRSLIITVLLTTALALVLNATEIWPFAWRWQYESNIGLVQALLTPAHTAALLYWLLLYSAGVPILEEVVFRFGLLRTLEHFTRSARVAAGVSAVAFGMLHLGYPPWSPDVGHMWNAMAVALFGLALAALVIKQGGKISLAIVAHVTLNAVSQAMLLVAASR
jgi:hypothetical protein